MHLAASECSQAFRHCSSYGEHFSLGCRGTPDAFVLRLFSSCVKSVEDKDLSVEGWIHSVGHTANSSILQAPTVEKQTNAFCSHSPHRWSCGGKLAGETLIISSRFDLTTLTSELWPWQAPKWWRKKKTCWELEDNSYTCALSPKREEWKQNPNKVGHASSPSSLDYSEWKHNDVASLTTLIVLQRDTLTPGINCLPENGAKDLKCARAQTPLDLLTSKNQDICQTTGCPKLPTYRTAVTKSEG